MPIISRRTAGPGAPRSLPLSAGAALVGALAALVVAGPLVVGAAAATSPTTAVPTSPAPSSSSSFTVSFDDGTTGGFTGDPRSVTVVPVAPGNGGRGGAIAVRGLTGYAQGASVRLPSSLPQGYYSLGATVRTESGALQDVRLVLSGGGSSVLQEGSARVGAAWTPVRTYAHLTNLTAGVRLRVEPVSHCSDAPAVPGPFQVDDVSVSFISTVPPPLPLLPTPTCPLGPSPSVTPSVTPSVPTLPACRVLYTPGSVWAGGFQATLSLSNQGTTPVTNWVLTWRMPVGETIGSAWPGPWSQSGTSVTMSAPSWAPDLAAGATTSIGFVASRTDTGLVPPITGVRLNGQDCLVMAPV